MRNFIWEITLGSSLSCSRQKMSTSTNSIEIPASKHYLSKDTRIIKIFAFLGKIAQGIHTATGPTSWSKVCYSSTWLLNQIEPQRGTCPLTLDNSFILLGLMSNFNWLPKNESSKFPCRWKVRNEMVQEQLNQVQTNVSHYLCWSALFTPAHRGLLTSVEKI